LLLDFVVAVVAGLIIADDDDDRGYEYEYTVRNDLLKNGRHQPISLFVP
jgi:hypothetical protein